MSQLDLKIQRLKEKHPSVADFKIRVWAKMLVSAIKIFVFNPFTPTSAQLQLLLLPVGSVNFLNNFQLQ
jgi:hypothetical protein